MLSYGKAFSTAEAVYLPQAKGLGGSPTGPWVEHTVSACYKRKCVSLLSIDRNSRWWKKVGGKVENAARSGASESEHLTAPFTDRKALRLRSCLLRDGASLRERNASGDEGRLAPSCKWQRPEKVGNVRRFMEKRLRFAGKVGTFWGAAVSAR